MDEKQIAAAVERVVRGMRPAHTCGGSCKALTLEKAKRLSEDVLAHALGEGVRAVVAVADRGGNPVCAMSSDGAFIASWDIAVQKAYTSVAMQMPTSELAKLAAPGAPLYGIEQTNRGKIVIFGGGEPLRAGGKLVGGLGVSGGTAEQDTALAAYGRKRFEEMTE